MQERTRIDVGQHIAKVEEEVDAVREKTRIDVGQDIAKVEEEVDAVREKTRIDVAQHNVQGEVKAFVVVWDGC